MSPWQLLRGPSCMRIVFDPRRLEPVIISDLRGVAGLNRDAVILSLGFGRTPHGRALHRFGEISAPKGSALLLNALGVTRRRFTLVSCFALEDLEVERLRSKGARMLGALLDFVSGGSGDPIETVANPGPPPGLKITGLMTSSTPVPQKTETAEQGVSPAGESARKAGAEKPAVGKPDVDSPSGEQLNVGETAVDIPSVGESGTGTPTPEQEERDPLEGREVSNVAEQTTDSSSGDAPLKTDEMSSEQSLDLADSAQTDVAQEEEDQEVVVDLSAGGPEPIEGPEPDRLLVDLADRLWRFGLTVETDYGLEGGEKIPLVAGHPDLPGEYLVAVLTDDMAYTAQPSLRARDRHRAERLERLGWHVVNVWAVALFLDPESQANQIREAVLRVEAARRSRNFVATGALPIIDLAVQQEFAEVEAAAGQDNLLETPDLGASPENLVLRAQRPDVPYGLPMTAYGDNQLDSLVIWIMADGVVRDLDELAQEVRQELGILRRSHRVDTSIANAIDRALGRN